MIAIGRVFAVSFAMLRQRFWPMVGMWMVFFVIQMLASSVLTLVVTIVGVAGALSFGEGLEDPAQLVGVGIGMMVIGVPLYAAYTALVFAQQAAVVALASPIARIDFSSAMTRGFKSILPFLALMVVLFLLYAVLVLGALAVAGLLGAGIGGPVGALLLLLLLPVTIYLACRLSPILAVVVVDEIYNPIAALRRCWGITRGKAIGILLVLVGTTLLGIAAIAVPFVLLFVLADATDATAGVVVAIVLLIGFLVMIPALFVYGMFSSAVIAAIHAEVTDGGAEQFEEVFA